ncbi:uncharacterized protein AB9X84_002299 isoform 1-T1 [Acanthopagrus schlegelii]
MKAVMIFLVLTLVVVMAEVGHGDIINTGNTETTGGLYVEGRKVTQLPPGYGPIINSGNTGTTGCITTEPMKAVMIFLVLTLVVVMAEAQSYGPISGSGNAETTGGLHFGGRRRATSQVEVAEDRLRRYYED